MENVGYFSFLGIDPDVNVPSDDPESAKELLLRPL